MLQNDEDCLKEISYIHSYWSDMSVENGCICLDERIGVPIKDALLGDIHSTHPGCFATLSSAQNEQKDKQNNKFSGPLLNEKGKDENFLTATDIYSEYPTTEIVSNASNPNVIKFLYI